MAILLNIGSSAAYDSTSTGSRFSTCLSESFNVFQLFVIIFSSYLAQKARLTKVIFTFFLIPVVAVLGILFALPHDKSVQEALMAGYCLPAFLFGATRSL